MLMNTTLRRNLNCEKCQNKSTWILSSYVFFHSSHTKKNFHVIRVFAIRKLLDVNITKKDDDILQKVLKN